MQAGLQRNPLLIDFWGVDISQVQNKYRPGSSKKSK